MINRLAYARSSSLTTENRPFHGQAPAWRRRGRWPIAIRIIITHTGMETRMHTSTGQSAITITNMSPDTITHSQAKTIRAIMGIVTNMRVIMDGFMIMHTTTGTITDTHITFTLGIAKG